MAGLSSSSHTFSFPSLQAAQNGLQGALNNFYQQQGLELSGELKGDALQLICAHEARTTNLAESNFPYPIKKLVVYQSAP